MVSASWYLLDMYKRIVACRSLLKMNQTLTHEDTRAIEVSMVCILLIVRKRRMKRMYLIVVIARIAFPYAIFMIRSEKALCNLHVIH